MSLRIFMDSSGNEWQAFDVVPRSTERRISDRRTIAASQADAERRERDRRLTVGGRSLLTSQSWLCFEHGADRRRLSPVPADWQRCSDAELDAYCRLARSVRRNFVSTQPEPQSQHQPQHKPPSHRTR